jgi:FAD/FMN-containing dehydrogenase
MSSSQDGLNELWDAEIGPHMDGLYLSFDTDTRPERLSDAFPGETLARLRRLKGSWDPDNVFRSNFPIPPPNEDARVDASEVAALPV